MRASVFAWCSLPGGILPTVRSDLISLELGCHFKVCADIAFDQQRIRIKLGTWGPHAVVLFLET